MNYKGNLIIAFSSIALALLIPPFIWHCKNRNIPATTLIFWLMFSNLTGIVGASIWSGDDFYEKYNGRGYCDVVIKLDSASGPGKLCASAAISLHLFLILKGASPFLIDSKSKRKVLLDCMICFFTPVLIMSTNYIVQAQRIGIAQYYGCRGIYARSWLTNVLMSMWQLIWTAIAMIFALLTIVYYIKKRRDARDLLKCTNSGLNIKKFARLLTFSLIILLTSCPLAIFYFVLNEANFRGPFSWSETHYEFWSETVFFQLDPKTFYDRWIALALSIAAFVLFGLGTDAVNMYRSILIMLKFDHVFNIRDPTIPLGTVRQLLGQSQGTGQSAFKTVSEVSGTTVLTGSTITDGIDMEFRKVMEDSDNTDISQTGSKGGYTPRTDNEKGLELSLYDVEEGSREELEYIINMANNDEEEIDFNYTQKFT